MITTNWITFDWKLGHVSYNGAVEREAEIRAEMAQWTPKDAADVGRDGAGLIRAKVALENALPAIMKFGEEADRITYSRTIKPQAIQGKSAPMSAWTNTHREDGAAITYNFAGRTVRRWFLFGLEMMTEADHAVAMEWVAKAQTFAHLSFNIWREEFYGDAVRDELRDAPRGF